MRALEMTDRSNLSMPPHSTAADLKTLDLSGSFCVFASHKWRNGIRRGLKILWSESSVRVRPPPPAYQLCLIRIARRESHDAAFTPL